jgi:hypothetical protein
LTISIPLKFKSEIAYVFHVLLIQNLNFKDEITYTESENDTIKLISERGSIELNNEFFGAKRNGEYAQKNLPTELVDLKNDYHPISCLYGINTLTEKDNHIYVGGDIIGSTFFLLTQWESTLLEGDKLGRYKFEGSTLQRLNIYERPLVNEYIAFLKAWLEKIGYKPTLNAYKPVFTCDVDSITKYSSFRNLLGGFRHRGISTEILKEYKTSRKDKSKDVYYSFDYLFRQLDKKGIDSIFYFMTDKEDKEIDTVDYDLNELLIQEVFTQIKERNHKIGLHPNINSWRNQASIRAQKEKLEVASKTTIRDIRMHYLRYNVNHTWAIQNELSFTSDSSMQFSEGIGFAAGMCTPYNLYDLKKRAMTHVKEWPLIVMKKKDYVRNVEESLNGIMPIMTTCKKYQGNYTLLFHNSDLETENEKTLFEKVLEVI